MLRKQVDEMQVLQLKMQELAQEVEKLKAEVKSKAKNDVGGFDKVRNASVVSEVFANKKIFNQLLKEINNSMGAKQGAPSSFGRIG